MNKKINEILRGGREKKRISLTDLAKLVNANVSSISNWEAGDQVPSGIYLLRLIKCLDLYDDFFPEKRQVKDSIEDRLTIVEKEIRIMKNAYLFSLEKK